MLKNLRNITIELLLKKTSLRICSLCVLIFFGTMLCWSTSGNAQYFGRNKVQYEDFDFRVLLSQHYKIYHYEKESAVAPDAAYMLERWLDRYKKVFHYSLKPHQPIIIYANHADFQQTNVIGGIIQQGTGGVTEGLKNRIVLPFTGIYGENDHVLGHELVHAFQYDIMKGRKGGLRGARRLPLWFIEGLAEYLSIGRDDPLTAMWMRDAVLHEDLPTIRDVSRDYRYFPYRYGHAIWAYMTGHWGDQIIPVIFNAALDSGWQKGVKVVLGIESDSLSKKWQTVTRDNFAPQLQGRAKPSEIGRPIITKQGGMNLAPVISPDGKYIAYLSRRDIFTLDLFLADAKTGEVAKKLVSSNTDSHFDALRFTNSAGAWSSNGEQFAFVVFKNGDNAIVIIDVKTGNIESTIKPEKVDAISNIAWSPESDFLAFSGTKGGIGDLYLFNRKTNELQKLTEGKFAEIQPTFSPDGRTIAFVTDRGSNTNFETFTTGSMKIGLYNLQNENIRTIALCKKCKHINPQFSADGNDLYFVANPDGFCDIYRYHFQTKEFFRITNIATGISGLTELSPTMSVSQKTGQIVFSVFEKTNYNIYTLNDSETKGSPVNPDLWVFGENSSLPPKTQQGRIIVENYLEKKPAQDVLSRENISLKDYDPSLGLTYIGQSTIGVAVDRFGTSLGGGVSMLFNDMLGHHSLGVVAQVNGGIKDIGGQVHYLNQKQRLNWGAGIAHIPYLTGYMRSGPETITIDGEKYTVQSRELIRQRVFLDRLNAIAEYPFSTNRRFEISAGYTRLSYSIESEKIWTVGGIIVDEEQKDLDAPEALNLFQPTLAYVGDYSFFGFTSPVNGKRFRFEIEPTMGSLGYVTAIADYRRYFFWNPFTFALRAFHVGRYLKDSENNRLTPLFIGHETFVRGYSLRSTNLSKMPEATDPYASPEFDRLVGSKIGVVNAELRVPLLGSDQFGILNFPYLPTEIACFLDAGIAWTEHEKPFLKLEKRSVRRVPVFSTGLAARFNLFGYFIVQGYYAYPFQRSGTGGHFGFVIAPGW